MTGYIHLCETCEGSGTTITMWDITGGVYCRMMWPPDSVGTWIPYKGKKPEIEMCEACSGLGYWEP